MIKFCCSKVLDKSNYNAVMKHFINNGKLYQFVNFITFNNFMLLGVGGPKEFNFILQIDEKKNN